MEDVIPESESLLLPLNLSPKGGGGAKAEEGHQEANGSEGRETGGEDREVEKEKASMNGGDEGKDEEKGGGLITHLMSIVSPKSTPKAGEVAKRKVEFEVEDDIGNGGFSDKSKPEQDVASGSENNGGGFISNLISNFFNQGDGGGRGENDEVDKAEKVMKDVGNKRMKMVEEEKGEVEGGGGGGGGIIDNFVSRLPTSLPDDAAPSTDEASILITSIVRD
ncbi:hypothetical protein L3X38_035042 [Prunus dulcis]|uniref:Uncharacterized protein n=1 Tax=Prunus dulcis TaxID=3755 RepID=A0AAD4VJ59_PRUDU|nr:hypothetical protein L3X38_035042 [Prunus dulcis]